MLWIARRERAEQDLHDELQTFVDMAAADKVRAGATPAEAHRLALLELEGWSRSRSRYEAAVIEMGVGKDGAPDGVRVQHGPNARLAGGGDV